MIAFWGLLAWAIYALVRAATRKPPRADHDGADARRILEQSLARGELEEAEDRRLRDLIGAGEQHEPAGTGTA